MPIEYKLVIVFVVVGFLNIIFRFNRNWIFGYRSPRAIKTHMTFAYANRIYGWGMMAAGVIFFLVLNYLESINRPFSGWSKTIFLISFFALLFALIEYKLSRAFKK